MNRGLRQSGKTKACCCAFLSVAADMYWASGRDDCVPEPELFMSRQKVLRRKGGTARHLHHLHFNISAMSETLDVSQQEFLVQFGFHGDSRE